MKILPIFFILFSSPLLLSACSQQFEGSTSLLQAYGDGYDWARNRDIHRESECEAYLTKTIIEALIARGCLAYISEHPSPITAPQSVVEEENQVRTSAEWTTQPSEEDFDLGYAWAEDEGIQATSECRAANASEAYVAGCVHYVQGE